MAGLHCPLCGIGTTPIVVKLELIDQSVPDFFVAVVFQMVSTAPTPRK